MKITLKTALLAAIFAFALNLLFARFLIGKISTIPLLNRLNILSPQAPIVINNHEEIRLTDSGQISDAINAARSKFSAVAVKTQNTLRLTGTAINLTADGSFVSSRQAFESKGDFWVILPDGRAAPITSQIPDPATGLVFFTTALNNVPIASLADSKSLAGGEKLLYFISQLPASSVEVWPDYLVRPEDNRDGLLFTAGKAGRVLLTAGSTGQAAASAVLNMKGEAAGLVVDGSILPADAIKAATALFLSGAGKIIRPQFDFTFNQLNDTQAQILKVMAGAQVVDVGKFSLLKSGDIIVKVAGQKIGQGSFLEEALEKFSPNDAIIMQIYRDGKPADLTIKAK